MAESIPTGDGEGLDDADRRRALLLIFRRHGRECVRPTAPTRVEIFRQRTGAFEPWEVVAYLPLTREFLAWRRDTNLDDRLKAKEFAADDDGGLDGLRVEFTRHWAVDFRDPDEDEDADASDDESPAQPVVDETFLKALDLGLTSPNSDDLAKLGKAPPKGGG